MLKVNCKDCRYRQILAKMCDCHVWGEDCDHYGDDLCKKMNDPEFIEYTKNPAKYVCLHTNQEGASGGA